MKDATNYQDNVFLPITAELISSADKWKYGAVYYTITNPMNIEDALDVLDEAGADGWEIFHIECVASNRFAQSYRALCKKRIVIDEPTIAESEVHAE